MLIWVCVWMGVARSGCGVLVDGTGEETLVLCYPTKMGKVLSSRDPRVRFAVRTFVAPLMVSAGVPQEEEGKGGDSEDEESREEGGQGPL